MAVAKTETVIGRIFDIERCSVHDGPGIRTTVFFKGCPLRCRWCHNPEGVTSDPMLSFLPDKCIGCGYCLSVCRSKVHLISDGQHLLDRSKCTACGLCAQGCYANALTLVGRDVTVDYLLDELVRDRSFYEVSGGGITLSGGEPLLQHTFCTALLRRAKQAGLHCCVETCGHCDYDCLEQISPYVDLFLYDWKDSDSHRHFDNCSVSNERIRANLRVLHDSGKQIILRCPIIPGINDQQDHFQGIALLAKSLPNLRGVELLPYHRLGESKLRRFGLDRNTTYPTPAIESGEVQQWIDELQGYGLVVTNSANQHVEP